MKRKKYNLKNLSNLAKADFRGRIGTFPDDFDDLPDRLSVWSLDENRDLKNIVLFLNKLIAVSIMTMSERQTMDKTKFRSRGKIV